MKVALTLFLLVVMSLNTVLPLMGQLLGTDNYEQCEKSEKESEKNIKEELQPATQFLVRVIAQGQYALAQKSFPKNDIFNSEHYALAIELPPEA